MRHVFALVGLLALGSCGDLCACTPPRSGIVVAGDIAAVGGAPRAGMLVQPEVGHVSCSAFTRWSQGRVSDSAGAFALEIELGRSDSVCVRLFVRDTASGPVELALPERYRVQLTGWPYDTLLVRLAVP